MELILVENSTGCFRVGVYRRAQAGMTMIVGMVMLLLLTIIGLAGINAANLEERMAGNQRDRALAFQSAEAGLRTAESVLDSVSAPAWNTPGYGEPVTDSGSIAFWETFAWNSNALQPNLGLANIAAQPQYYVEKITPNGSDSESGSAVDFSSSIEPETNYRITTRAVGASTNTIVILQSTYKVL